MLTGIYKAAMGMRGQLQIQDTLAQNLSNSATTAYKRKVPSFNDVLAGSPYELRMPNPRPRGMSSLAPAPVSIDGDSAYVYTSYTSAGSRLDRQSGNIKNTGEELDFAIEGNGMFTVQDPSGRRLFTRAGNFRKDADGDLATQQGFKVLGDQGVINIEGSQVSVTDDGEVMVDGVLRGKLLISEIANQDQVIELDGGLYQGQASPQGAVARVLQGSLEQSNVNVVEEMVAMIASLRAYEAAQRVLSAGDSMLGKAVNELGRV